MDYKEKVIALLNSQELSKEQKEKLESIFPELKESKDEKIKKRIIHALHGDVLEMSEIKEAVDWLEKQGEQNLTLPKWKYKKDNTPLLRDSIILNKYGCVAKSPSGALVSDVWVLDYAELAKLPKEEIEKQCEQKPTKWSVSDFRTWQYIVADVLTKKDGIGQYLDSGECKKIAKYMQEEWGGKLGKEQTQEELCKGENYGIDGLYHAISILEKTLGKVDGYQSDDGILEHKCAINAVKELYEQKPAETEKGVKGNNREIPNSEPKPIDKVEPKFKVGDIISDGFSEVKIVSIDKNNYNVTNDEIENDAHIGNWVVYFKDQDNWKLVEQTPADKVDQHSLPVSDNSSLPTFDESIYHPCTEGVYEQKPATWSEEDELHIRELESLVKRVWAIAEHENDKDTIHKMSDLSFFLKTLKPQLKQEWSEDDEERLSDAIFFVREYQIPTRDKRLLNAAKETEDWLRTFKDRVKPQSHWKPSKEQMDMLAKLCSTLHLTSGENEIMESLYEQLEKLREE